MKKISRAVGKFFKSIARFFDKWLITPLTKFFVAFMDFFNNKGSKFEKILVNRQSLVIISLLFALITFYMIDEKHVTLIDKSAEVLYNQKVNVKTNEALYVVEGVPEEVDVTLVGRKMDVYLAKQYPLNGVTLDLTGYTPGSYSVGFKYEQAVSSVEYKVDPSSVNIRIYDKISVTKEVSKDIIHKDHLDSKLYIDEDEIIFGKNEDNVIVKGASHRLDEVATVKAIIDIDKISNIKVGTITLSDVPLIAYDSEGNKMDVEIVPATVNATIKITSPSKEVPIKLNVDGKLDDVAIKSLTPSINKVTIYGSQEALSKIDNLPVKVDVNGVKEDKTYSINLSKPNGVREISEKTITVDLKVGNVVSRDIPGIPIDARNLENGYSVQVIGEKNITATVIVNGVKEIVDSIDSSSIRAYVDLKGKTTGEYTVPVYVEGDNTMATYSSRVKEITVKISK